MTMFARPGRGGQPCRVVVVEVRGGLRQRYVHDSSGRPDFVALGKNIGNIAFSFYVDDSYKWTPVSYIETSFKT